MKKIILMDISSGKNNLALPYCNKSPLNFYFLKNKNIKTLLTNLKYVEEKRFTRWSYIYRINYG